MIQFFNNLKTGALQETWVFMLGGQSNMRPQTGTTGNGITDQYPTDYLQWGRFGAANNTLIQATKPLQHIGNEAGSVGPGFVTRFANRMKVAYPFVRLVFIPCGQGGTSFKSNNWNKGDFNYEDLISRTNLCLSQNPTYILRGFLWHQGESDSTNASYASDFNQFNIDWRNDILKATSNTPFVCGGLLPAYVTANSGAATVNTFLTNVPNNINYSGFASASTPTVLTGWDTVHFNSTSSLTLGDRYFESFLTALTNF